MYNDLKDYATMALGVMNGDQNAVSDYIKNRTRGINNELLSLHKIMGTVLDKKVKKYIPKEEMIGYRWTQSKNGKIYIVKLHIKGEYWHDPEVGNTLDYVTDSCSIISIEDIETGEFVDDIGETTAYFHSNKQYSKGELIDKEKTWFCLNKEMLFFSQGQAINRVAHKEIIPLL